MGELILCNESIAAVPYYLEDVSINVYSLEEISYYIKQQAYLLDVSFSNQDLCNWIRRELHLKDLSNQLEKDIEEHEPLHVFVAHILNSCGYLTKTEIKETIEIVASYENKTEAEVRKMRADRLMNSHRIVDAVYAYESIIDKKPVMSTLLEGNIYHNLGSAYSKLYFFERAASCYENAYRLNRNKESLNCLLSALYLTDDSKLYEDAIIKYQVLPEDVKAIEYNIEKIDNDEKIKSFKEAISHMRNDYPTQDEYRNHLNGIVKRWEKEYATLCKL